MVSSCEMLSSIYRHLPFSAKWGDAADEVAGVALGVIDAAWGEMFDVALAGEFFEGYVAVAVHENEERVFVFVFKNESFDDGFEWNAERLSSMWGSAVVDIVVGVAGIGNIVLGEELGGGGADVAGGLFHWARGWCCW